MQDKAFLFVGLSALIHVSVIGGFIAQTKISEHDEHGSSAVDIEIITYKKNLNAAGKSFDEPPVVDKTKQQSVVHTDKPADNKAAELSDLNQKKSIRLAGLNKTDMEKVKQQPSNVTEKENAAQIDKPDLKANSELLESIIRSELARHFYYPKVAQRRNWQGQVLLGYTVTAAGTIEKIRVNKSSGFQVLDEAAITALKKVDSKKEMAVATNGLNVDQILPVKYSLVE